MTRFLSALVCGGMLALGGQALARDLVVGVEDLEYYPIFAIRDGEYVGAAREILDAFAKARGHRLTYRPLPIKRLTAALIKGDIDLRFPDNAYWAGESKKGAAMVYSAPVIAFIDGVLVRGINFGRSADSVAVLGTITGFTPFSWMDRIRAGQVAVKENARVELLLRQAIIGRVDGAYVNVAAANYVLSNILNMQGSLVFDPGLPHMRSHYHLSTVTHPEIIEEFNLWIKENQELVRSIKIGLAAEKGVN